MGKLKHFLIYGFGNISTKLIGFVLLPLYTKYLTVEQFGILTLIEITSQILIGVLSFNIGTAMMRWLVDAKSQNEEKSIVFTVLIETTIISFLIIFLMWFFDSELSWALFGNSSFSNYIILLGISSALGIFILVPLNLMRQYEKSILFSVLTTIKFTLSLLLTIWFVKYLSWGIEGVLLAQIIGQIIFVLATIPLLLKNTNLKFSFKKLFEMLNYGFPLVLSTISTLLLTMSDRYIIKIFESDAEVGIYSLAYKISSVINMLIIQSYQLAFLPIAYQKITQSNYSHFFQKSLKYFTIVLVISALSISIFSKEIIEILSSNTEFYLAIYLIPILSLSFVLRGIQYQISLGFHFSKKTKYNGFVVFVAALINIILNIVFVKYFGFFGVAYAVTISLLLTLPLMLFFSQKFFFIQYKFLQITAITIVGILFYGISLLFDDYAFVLRFSLKSILLFLFIISLFILRLVTKNEILSLKNEKG